jgi:hypothetical protein
MIAYTVRHFTEFIGVNSYRTTSRSTGDVLSHGHVISAFTFFIFISGTLIF